MAWQEARFSECGQPGLWWAPSCSNCPPARQAMKEALHWNMHDSGISMWHGRRRDLASAGSPGYGGPRVRVLTATPGRFRHAPSRDRKKRVRNTYTRIPPVQVKDGAEQTSQGVDRTAAVLRSCAR